MSNFKIRAGAANCPINFPEKMFPTDGLKAVHDAPYMGVVLLEAGTRCALVSMELVNVPDDAVDMARKIVSETADVPYENVWIHATHTITSPHAPGGPMGKGPGGPGGSKGPGRPQDPDAPMKRELFIETIRDAVTDCARRAASDLAEARIGVGTSVCEVNVNRDIETPHGWWIGLGGNGVSDKELTVIKIERADGRPVCFLVSYGMKPCAIDNSEMQSQSRLVSGDVPGYACRMAQEQLGAPVMYFTPAAANQVPREQAWFDAVDSDGNIYTEDLGVEAGLKIVEKLGAEMGNAVLEAASGIECSLEESVLRTASGEIQADSRGRASMPKKPALSQEFVLAGKQEVGSAVFNIGDIAFVSVKPEMNAQTGIALKESSPFAHTVIMSMTNGGMKYMPDKYAYENVTWESQNTSLFPGSAELWCDMVLSLLEKLR